LVLCVLASLVGHLEANAVKTPRLDGEPITHPKVAPREQLTG
jgi:hypothetical protein